MKLSEGRKKVRNTEGGGREKTRCMVKWAATCEGASERPTGGGSALSFWSPPRVRLDGVICP